MPLKNKFVTLGLFCALTTSVLSQELIGYNILPTSSLTISGNSNVNKFSCELKNNFNRGECELKATLIGEVLRLDGAVLEVEVMNLDCNNRRMDEDLQCALKSDEYPNLTLNILEINYKGSADQVLENTFTSALVEIIIAGTSRRVLLNFNDIRYSNNLLSFTGVHQIDMRDFNIEPPQVLWGLIKVDGLIKIDFELKVKLNQGTY